MTVALRLGAARGCRRARRGARDASCRRSASRSSRRVVAARPPRCVAVPARRAARAGRLADPLHARGRARSAPSRDVGRRSARRRSSRVAIALIFLDEPLRLPLVARRARDRRRRRRCSPRERDRPGHLRAGRARLRRRRGGRSSRRATTSSARCTPHASPETAAAATLARRARSSAALWTRRAPTPARAAARSRRPASCSGSPTSASSRRTSAAASRVVSPLVATESLWGVGLVGAPDPPHRGGGAAAGARRAARRRRRHR